MENVGLLMRTDVSFLEPSLRHRTGLNKTLGPCKV